jgi:hypothetical protein
LSLKKHQSILGVYLHSNKILAYKEHNNGKIAGYKGPVWCREIIFDIDHSGNEFIENISLSLDSAKSLIQLLKNAGLISINTAYSGNKGFHVTASSQLLDKLSGFYDTPLRLQYLAHKLAGNISGIDYCIYGNSTRLIRSLNTINAKSGLYKIPLFEDEINTLSPEEIISLARNPRKLAKKITIE